MMNINEFIKREDDANLFSIKYKNIPLWELVRFDIFNEYIGRCQKSHWPLSKRLNNWLRTIFGLIFSNPLFFLSKKKTLIIRASRKSIDNKKLIDPYTIDIEKDISNRPYGIYESHINFIFKKLFTPNITILDIITKYISKILLKVKKKKFFNDELSNQIKFICSIFPEKEFSTLIENKLMEFYIEQKLYSFILKHRKPERVYLTNYVYKQALIYSAKLFNIQVIEIQHGFISPLLADYHFPKVKKGSLLLFPDEFYYLSEYLKYKVDLPLPEISIKPFEGNFFRKKLKMSKSMDKNPNSLLFVSTNNKEFTSFMENFCKISKENKSGFKIYFKPHPFEYALIDTAYINSLKENYNIIFIEKDEDIYQYIGKIKYVISTYSTLLFEALEFGNAIYTVKLNGHELIMPFVENNLMNLVNSPQELYDSIIYDNKM